MLHLKMNESMAREAADNAERHLIPAMEQLHRELSAKHHDHAVSLGLTYAALFYGLAELLAQESEQCTGRRDSKGVVRVSNDLMHTVNQYRTAINRVRTGGSN